MQFGPILSVLADPILPVFAIVVLGWIMGRAGAISQDDARVINRFAMTLLLPIMVFGIITDAPFSGFDPRMLLAYFLAEIVVFAFGFWLARRVFGRGAGESVLLGFCGLFANNAMYVLPIANILYGPGNAVPITMIVALDAVFAFGAATVALQMIRVGRVAVGTILGGFARTGILWGIGLGVLVAAMGWDLGRPARTFLDFNGAAAAPVSLFAMGVVMARTPMRPDRVVALFAAIKLFVLPVLVWLAMVALIGGNPLADTYARMFLMGAAGPTGVMAFSMALLYDVKTDTILQVILWTCLLSLLSLAVLA